MPKHEDVRTTAARTLSHSVLVALATTVAFTSGACGSRSELLVGVALTSDAGARDAAIEAGVPACTGFARPITDVRAGAQLLGATRGPGDTVWVSWQEALAAPVEYPSTMISSIDADGGRVFEREGLPRPRIITGFIGLPTIEFNRATNEGASVGWDSDNGCSMLRFDANGGRLGAPFDPLPMMFTGFPLERCRALRPWRTGWSFLADEIRAVEGIGMVRLARDGSRVSDDHLVTTSGQQPVLTRASLDDGSFLLGWHYLSTRGDTEVRLLRFGEDGAELSTPTTLAGPAPSPARLRMTAVDGAVLAAWQQPASTGAEPSAQYRLLTRDGAAASEVFSLGTEGGGAYGGALSVAAAGQSGGEAVIVYATRGPGAAMAMTTVRRDGAPAGTAQIFADAGSITDTVTVSTERGPVVLFEASLRGAVAQVYALPLRCR